MATVTCPECQEVLKLPSKAVGKPLVCPTCNSKFTAETSRRPNLHDARRPIPDYRGMLIVARVFLTVGWIMCCLGAMGLILAVVVASGSPREQPNSWAWGLISYAPLVGIPAGVTWIGMGLLFRCIRDMAQNSFRSLGNSEDAILISCKLSPPERPRGS